MIKKKQIIYGNSLEYISEALLKTGGKLIQISRDYVFDGKKKNLIKLRKK